MFSETVVKEILLNLILGAQVRLRQFRGARENRRFLPKPLPGIVPPGAAEPCSATRLGLHPPESSLSPL